MCMYMCTLYTYVHTYIYTRRWHWLDVLVIIAMFLEAASVGNIEGLATLRLLRILRLAVLLRNVKSVHDAYRVRYVCMVFCFVVVRLYIHEHFSACCSAEKRQIGP